MIVDLAIAAYWAEEFPGQEPPCFRLTSDIDFLRRIVRSRNCVDIVDDADRDTIPIKKVKALLDVSLVETMSKERWNAVKCLASIQNA